LESSYRRNVFAYCSPQLIEINSAFSLNSSPNTIQKDRQAQTRVAVLSIPGINAGAFGTIQGKQPASVFICEQHCFDFGQMQSSVHAAVDL
jgi:hypothetical protein